MPDDDFFASECFDEPEASPPAIPPAISSGPVEYSKVVTELQVTLPDGRSVSVPADAESAKLGLQVMTAEVANFFRRQVRIWDDMGIPMSPKELKELVQGAESIDSLVRAQFLGAENDALARGLGASTPLGKMVQKMVNGAARAAAAGTAEAVFGALGDRAARMKSAKKSEPKVIDVSATPKS
jgi:hypothetical protein